jgi:hypothetical protein
VFVMISSAPRQLESKHQVFETINRIQKKIKDWLNQTKNKQHLYFRLAPFEGCPQIRVPLKFPAIQAA